MFLSLIGKAICKEYGVKVRNKCQEDNDDHHHNINFNLSITIYDAKQKDYPISQDEWNSYDGIILPGSFSAAYDEDEEWITYLQQNIIQDEIHPNARKTLAVCFGHQAFAHSFRNVNRNGGIGDDDSDGADGSDGGLAIPCPKGTQIGCRGFRMTSIGSDVLLSDQIVRSKSNNDVHVDADAKGDDICCSMLYTHGDMVQDLPSCASSLGGTDTVPIQAACYFSSRTSTPTPSPTRKSTSASESTCTRKDDNDDDPLKSTCTTTREEESVSKSLYESTSQVSQLPLRTRIPYAVTFQGHPEYTSGDIGMETFVNIFKYLKEQNKLPPSALSLLEQEHVLDDARNRFNDVEADCVHITHVVSKMFQWI